MQNIHQNGHIEIKNDYNLMRIYCLFLAKKNMMREKPSAERK